MGFGELKKKIGFSPETGDDSVKNKLTSLFDKKKAKDIKDEDSSDTSAENPIQKPSRKIDISGDDTLRPDRGPRRGNLESSPRQSSRRYDLSEDAYSNYSNASRKVVKNTSEFSYLFDGQLSQGAPRRPSDKAPKIDALAYDEIKDSDKFDSAFDSAKSILGQTREERMEIRRREARESRKVSDSKPKKPVRKRPSSELDDNDDDDFDMAGLPPMMPGMGMGMPGMPPMMPGMMPMMPPMMMPGMGMPGMPGFMPDEEDGGFPPGYPPYPMMPYPYPMMPYPYPQMQGQDFGSYNQFQPLPPSPSRQSSPTQKPPPDKKDDKSPNAMPVIFPDDDRPASSAAPARFSRHGTSATPSSASDSDDMPPFFQNQNNTPDSNINSGPTRFSRHGASAPPLSPSNSDDMPVIFPDGNRTDSFSAPSRFSRRSPAPASPSGETSAPDVFDSDLDSDTGTSPSRFRSRK